MNERTGRQDKTREGVGEWVKTRAQAMLDIQEITIQDKYKYRTNTFTNTRQIQIQIQDKYKYKYKYKTNTNTNTRESGGRRV